MLLFRKEHAAVLVFALTQWSVFATSNIASNETENSTELIGRFLTLPWMDGLDRLVHSSESPDTKKVKTFIRAAVAGETWATQILHTLHDDFADMEERRARYFREALKEANDDCTRAELDNDTVVEDGHCGAAAVCAGLEHTQSSIVTSDSSVSCKGRNEPTANKLVPSAAKGSKEFSMAKMATIVFFSTVVLVLLGCTMCDFVKTKSPEKSSATVDTLAKFSLYRNGLAVFSAKSEADTMPAIHGLRCLCFCIIIVGHRWVLWFSMFNTQVFLLDLLSIRGTPFGLLLEMATYAVDTFSVIGGFLVAHTFIKVKKSGLKFNVFTMYLKRYLRLTPCMVAIMLCALFLTDYLGSGPMWDTLTPHVVQPCRENWWINFLYLQNVISPDRMCVLNTWFLALDMQLFWISPLILYPLYYSPKLGLRILSFFLVVGLLNPPIFLMVKGYSNLVVRLDMDILGIVNNLTSHLMSTQNRAFPYFVGILLGYDVATRKRTLTKTNVAINWTVSCLLLLFCTCMTNFTYNSGFVGDWHLEIPAALLLHTSWSFGIAWVLYACTQGYGGWVTRFLSLPIFLPLSRLSYCIYLVHMPIQASTITFFYGSANSSRFFYIMNGFFADLALSTVVAFVFHLCIERPCIVLTKIFLQNRDREPKVVTLVEKESNNKSDPAMEKYLKSN